MSLQDNTPPAPDPGWEAFRKGDRDAFAQLYDEHAPPLIVYGIRVSGDEGLVRDVIQDLFVEIWRSRANLQSPGSVRGYLLKALRYKLMRKVAVRLLYADSLPEQADTANPESIILEHENEIIRRQPSPQGRVAAPRNARTRGACAHYPLPRRLKKRP